MFFEVFHPLVSINDDQHYDTLFYRIPAIYSSAKIKRRNMWEARPDKLALPSIPIT